MLFFLSLCLHIIGLSLWMGGLFILIAGLKASPRPLAFLETIRTKYVGTGLVLVLVTGVYQVAYHGVSYYLTQGWFHGKVTAIVLLLIATFLTWTEISRVSTSEMPPPKWFYPVVHSLAGLGFLAAVVFVILGRSGQL